MRSNFPRQRTKYGNKKEGGFDSAKERKRYQDLLLLEKIGAIKDLQRQVKFNLIPKQEGDYRNERAVDYVADFQYVESENIVVEDVKGFRTPDYVIKRKLMLYIHGVSIYET